MKTVSYLLLQITVFIALAPLINGIIKKVKAITQKRKGAPVLQMYFDIYKLLKKDSVISDTASWIYKATPYIVFSTVLVGALLVPAVPAAAPKGFMGDALLLVYLLALGRFFMTLSGLDTGSTFGGMGSSREVMISALFEPSLLVVLFSTGLISKSTSIFKMMTVTDNNGGIFTTPAYLLLFLAIFFVIIAETSRIPVDDPATHLELTMVHEAMLLEYSGRQLALMELGASVKQLLLITLLVNLFIPSSGFISAGGVVSGAIFLGLYVVKVIAAAILIAITEVSTVKLKLFSVPNLAALSFILAFIGFLQYFVVGR